MNSSGMPSVMITSTPMSSSWLPHTGICAGSPAASHDSKPQPAHSTAALRAASSMRLPASSAYTHWR